MLWMDSLPSSISITSEPDEVYDDEKACPLIQACADDRIIAVNTLLKQYASRGLSIRTCDSDGDHAVHLAARLANTTCLEALLQYDRLVAVDVDAKGTTPLMIAICEGAVNAVKVLLEYLDSDDILQEDKYGCNALSMSVQYDTDIALLLLEKCPNEKYWECSAETLLSTVIRWRQIKVLQRMLELGLRIDSIVNKEVHGSSMASKHKMPYALVPCCFFVNWVEALKVITSAVKKRLGASEPQLVEHHIGYMFALAVCYPLWDKVKALDYVLSIQSCADFDQYFFDYVHSTEDALDIATKKYTHPLEIVAFSIIEEDNLHAAHSIESSVRLLINHGFSFSFKNIFHLRFGVCDTLRFLTHLTCLSCETHPEMFRVTMAVLKYATELEPACQFVPGFPQLAFIKQLARESKKNINSVYNRYCIVGNKIGYIEQEYEVIVPFDTDFQWQVVAHFALKGFQIYPYAYHHYHRYHRIIPFPVLMLKDDRRMRYFQQQPALQDDPFKEMLLNRRVSSLRSLCRHVIRDGVHPTSLLGQPLLSVWAEFPEAIVRQMWPFDYMVQLPIPHTMRDFLYYGPEMREYQIYYSRVTKERSNNT